MSKITDIIRSNVNAVMKKFENPEYLLDLKLEDAKEEFQNVKQELGKIKAEEMAAQRKVDEIQSKVAEFAGLAEMAVQKGNDNDAITFLKKKNDIAGELESAKQTLELTIQNSKKIEGIYHQLEERISSMASDASMIKSQISIAKTQEKLNEMVSSVAGKANSAFGEFENLKTDAQKRLDAANAIANLNGDSEIQELEALKNKYSSNGAASSELDELAALKAKLGK